MEVKKLELKNFRGFRDLTLEFDSRLNVLVGVNGSGKSSVLDALSIMLAILVDPGDSRPSLSNDAGLNQVDGYHFEDSDIYCDEPSLKVKVSFRLNGFERELLEIMKRGQTRETNGRVIHSSEGSPDDIAGFLSRIPNDTDGPIILHYPVIRKVKDISLKAIMNFDVSRSTAYADALSPYELDFNIFFEWFRNREDVENERRVREPTFRDVKMSAVRKAISLVPSIGDINVKREKLSLEIQKDKRAFDIRQLSDGEKCLIAMMGDIARRLAIANPRRKNPLEGEGIIMIDEIDLHLHPGWQRMIVPRLLETFPNCQFIITTHSPQVLGEVPADKIIVLDREPGTNDIVAKKLNQSLGLNADIILEDIMGAKSRNENVEQKLNEIFTLVDDNNYEKARDEIAKLRKTVKGSLPEIDEAEAEMNMLKD